MTLGRIYIKKMRIQDLEVIMQRWAIYLNFLRTRLVGMYQKRERKRCQAQDNIWLNRLWLISRISTRLELRLGSLFTQTQRYQVQATMKTAASHNERTFPQSDSQGQNERDLLWFTQGEYLDLVITIFVDSITEGEEWIFMGNSRSKREWRYLQISASEDHVAP